MSNRKQRHLSPAGFLLALALLIVGIFAADYVYRLFFRSSTENIIGTGGFSTTSSSSGTASEDGENATDSTEETQPSGIVLQLTAADQASGPLVLADASHPYMQMGVARHQHVLILVALLNQLVDSGGKQSLPTAQTAYKSGR